MQAIETAPVHLLSPDRFEFRAVGSSQSIGASILTLNVIVAESVDFMATELEKAGPEKRNETIQKLLKDVMDEHGGVIFNGNGYTEEWHAEAEKRGLPNLRTTIDALPAYTSPSTIAAFEKYGILTARELASRKEIMYEHYVKSINVEANTVIEMAKTIIFPAAMRYQGELAETAAKLRAAGLEPDTTVLHQVTELAKALLTGVSKVEAALYHGSNGSAEAHATHFKDAVLPAMLEVRAAADALEGIVADDLWPLPTYQEMLFIK
jgi:glutamine synthetase